MSVIVGIIQPEGAQNRVPDIRRMLRRLAYSAPDGLEVWCNQHAALGHGMLQSSAESVSETQPFRLPAADLAIAADARVDNRAELIEACGLSGRPHLSDSALILAAYERWGEALVDKLSGDFAFAIWDGHKRQLFCARDPFGVRPFFYHHSRDRFVFASQIKALFEVPDVPRNLNESRIADHVLGFFQDRSSTFFEGVSRLAPGHTLTVGASGLRTRCYWKPDARTEIRRASDEDYAEEFRAIFAEAVRCRLSGTAPLGAMLSGGLDSSSIACMARHYIRADSHNRPLYSYSGTFQDDPKCDERTFLTPILKGGGFLPRYLDCDQANPFAAMDQTHSDLDEVAHGMGVTVPALVYRRAAEDGVRVVLDGQGGDEVVSHGLRYLNELLFAGDYAAFARETLSHARIFQLDQRRLAATHLRPYFLDLKQRKEWFKLSKAMLQIPPKLNHPTADFLRDFAFRPLAMKLSRRNAAETANGSILSGDFEEAISLRERHERTRVPEPGLNHTLRDSQCHRLHYGELWMTIEELGRAAAAVRIEPRYPMLDRRLVEFCLSLPSRQRFSDGWSRSIFRRAMHGILPEEVQWRGGKAMFLDVFAVRLRTQGRDLLDATIVHTPPRCAHYFNLTELRERHRRFMAGDDAPARELWRSANLIWWLENSKLSATASGEVSEVATHVEVSA